MWLDSSDRVDLQSRRRPLLEDVDRISRAEGHLLAAATAMVSLAAQHVHYIMPSLFCLLPIVMPILFLACLLHWPLDPPTARASRTINAITDRINIDWERALFRSSEAISSVSWAC